jgi:hypothetical protein
LPFDNFEFAELPLYELPFDKRTLYQTDYIFRPEMSKSLAFALLALCAGFVKADLPEEPVLPGEQKNS